jgi:hypothetical protein
MCRECRIEAAENRERLDQQAARRLDAIGEKAGYPGRWPCALSLCEREGDPASVFHPRADISLWHTSRAKSWGVTIPGLKGCDRSPVCRACDAVVSYQVLMRQGVNDDD